jgi:hypothetical protein
MVDCDGSADHLLAQIAQTAPRLSEIFAFCEGFPGSGDLLSWLRAHRIKPVASYVNWLGRTAVQVREEARLHALLREALPHVRAQEPQKVLAELRDRAGGAATLTPIASMSLEWRIRETAHLVFPFVIAASCLLLFPLITVVLFALAATVFLIILRRNEQSDPTVPRPYESAKVAMLREGEDHDVSNQYTAIGSIKPGRFRLWTEIAILFVVDWAARHVYNRGGLGRIGTIHFAHWVFIDERRRGFFCSNYDGGHEAYMDDFINKAGFGLNLSFSNFIGYPATDWLLARGAWREQDFKRFQRHHQIPTDVWYKAYPGLTARDLARNKRIRNGFEKAGMDDDEIRRWLAEI